MADVAEEEHVPKVESSAPPSFWFWGASDRLFLGLGTMLYLNFLRFTALLFFLLFMTALPNMTNNAAGNRYNAATSSSAFLNYVSTVSLSNLGSTTWTMGGDNACSGRGFGAMVCAPGGWSNGANDEFRGDPGPGDDVRAGLLVNESRGVTVYSYDCGRAPSGAPAVNPIFASQRGLVSGEVNYTCSRKVFMCVCMPGFNGSDCSNYFGPLGYNASADANATAPEDLNAPPPDPNATAPFGPIPYPNREIADIINATLTLRLRFGVGNASRVGDLRGLTPFQQRAERARALAATNVFPPDLGIAGWCVPPIPTWAGAFPLEQADMVAKNLALTNVYGVCSGRGTCTARTLVTDPNVLDYTFCQCNIGFYGAQCEFAEDAGGGDTFGLVTNDPATAATSALCRKGALPFATYNFVLFSLQSQNCSTHGLGLRFPTLPDGRLIYSNADRTQTTGVCFCEPGFAGEECLGGAPVPDSYGYVGVAQSIIFFLVMSAMYKVRRVFMVDVNNITITPNDFTIFVLLPQTVEFNARKSGGLDIARVRHHFSQWGPIHCVAPAIDDWPAILLQKERNRVMRLLHIKLEEAEFKRNMAAHKAEMRRKRAQDRADKASRAAARAAGADVEEPDPRAVRALEIDKIMAEPDWEEHDEEQRAKAALMGLRLPPAFALDAPRPPWYVVIAPDIAQDCIAKPVKAERPYGLPPANTDTFFELEGETASDKVKAAEAAYAAKLAAEKEHKASATSVASAGAVASAPQGAAASAAPLPGAPAGPGAAASGAPGAAPGAAAPSIGTVGVVKGRRVFPAVEISRMSRVVIRLPGTAFLYNTRFLRAYGRWIEAQIDVHRNDPDTSLFENAFVTFCYARDATDCAKSYEMAGLFELQAKVDPRLKQIRQTQGLAEGEYFYESKRTGKRKLVNLMFQTQGIDRIRKQLAPHMPAAVKRAEELRLLAVDGGAQRTEVYLPPLRGVERAEVEVDDAMLPSEVMWGAMDSSPADQLRLAVIFVMYQMAISLVCFLIVFNLNNGPKRTGIMALASTVAVTATNQFGAKQWTFIISYEENYSVGATMRSVFFKTVSVQLAITLLSATLAVFGLPLDNKNGYIGDFYTNAGGFLAQSILIDSLIDIIVGTIAIPKRIKQFTMQKAKSRLEWFEKQLARGYALEFKTAGTMRMIVLVSAFSPGCPPILLSGAVSLFLNYVGESNDMMDDARLQVSGAELARALEYSLCLCCLLNAGMNWAIFSSYWGTNAASGNFFFLAIFLVTWAMLGYFSWKWYDAKDAFLGWGVLPGINSLPMAVRNVFVPPLQRAHEMYLNLIFGRKFFWLPAQLNTVDPTEGRPYYDISASDQASLGETGAGLGDHAELQTVMSKFSMRAYPYYCAERTEIFPDLGSPEPLGPIWAGDDMMDWAQRDKRADRIYFRKVEKAKFYGRPQPPVPKSVAMNIARQTGGGAEAFFPRSASDALSQLLLAHKAALAGVLEPLRNEFFYMDKDGDGELSAADAKAARVPQAVFLAILNAVGMTHKGSLDCDTFVLLKLQAGVGGRVPMELRQETAHLLIELQAAAAWGRLQAKGRVRMGSREMRAALRDAGLGDAGIKDEAAAELRLDRFDGDHDGMLELSDFFALLAAERGVTPSAALMARRAAKASKRVRSLMAALTQLQKTTMLVHAQERFLDETPVADVAFGLQRNNLVRRFLITLVRNDDFQYYLTALILANACIMGIYDPMDRALDTPGESVRNQIVHGSEKFFAVVFSLEAIVKLIAFGPGRTGNGYFAIGWNVMDFCLVLLVWFQFAGHGGALVSNLRVFRMLRLVAMAQELIPPVRIIIMAVYASLPGLGQVSLLALASNYIFAMIGVYLWRGNLAGQCGYYDAYGYINTPNATDAAQPWLPDPSGDTSPVWHWMTDYLSFTQYCALDCDDVSASGGVCSPAYGDACLPQNVPLTSPDGTSYWDPSVGYIGSFYAVTNTSCMANQDPDCG
jgi:hypothetical protein